MLMLNMMKYFLKLFFSFLHDVQRRHSYTWLNEARRKKSICTLWSKRNKILIKKERRVLTFTPFQRWSTASAAETMLVCADTLHRPVSPLMTTRPSRTVNGWSRCRRIFMWRYVGSVMSRYVWKPRRVHLFFYETESSSATVYRMICIKATLT